MISLTYKQIRNLNFSAALKRLGGHSGFTGRQAYHIGRIVDQALSFEKKCVFEENKIHLKYARTNEDGSRYVPEGANPNYFEIDEASAEKHEQELEELMKETVEIDKQKIPISDLDQAGLTPAQMVAIEPLLETETNVIPIKKGESNV